MNLILKSNREMLIAEFCWAQGMREALELFQNRCADKLVQLEPKPEVPKVETLKTEHHTNGIAKDATN